MKEFLKHINDKAPAFRCYDCTDREEQLTLTAKVSNKLNPPASSDGVAEIRSLLGAAGGPFQKLFRKHNGMLLYRDSRSRAAGVRFFPVEEWSARSEEMREQFLAMGCEEEEMPTWMKRCIVFGEIPQSANYFAVSVGRGAGKIYYADHDDFRNTPFAKGLEELLDKIRNDPAEFLYKCGCFTRYSDGKTGTQWIPKEYISDVKAKRK
jgi:hypothetical protein